MSNFICQRCKLPLYVDDSLKDLSAAQRRLLTTSYSAKPESALSRIEADTDSIDQSNTDEKADFDTSAIVIPESRKKMFKKALEESGSKPLIGGLQHKSSGASEGSFVILDEKAKDGEKLDSSNKTYNLKNAHSLTPVSDQVSSMTNIFNVISSKCDLDYPMCSDCADLMIDKMTASFDQLTKEKDTYVQFLKKLKAQSVPKPEKCKSSLLKHKQLKEEQENVLKDLQEEEETNQKLKAELVKTEKELERVQAKKEETAKMENEYQFKLDEDTDELNRVKAIYESNMDQLDSLRKVNVFNDTFNIAFTGLFGTINGLRLGSTNEEKVSWHEINAALGQIVLLLSVCVRILGIKMENYILVPLGSTSRIEKVKRNPQDPTKGVKTVYELYCQGELSIGSIFTHNKLDAGMVALVDVIRTISTELRRRDPTNELPFPMTTDKVAGYNIRPSARTSNEDWAAACKYLLTNIKWILTITMAHYHRE